METQPNTDGKIENQLKSLFEDNKAWGVLCLVLSIILCYYWGINSLLTEVPIIIVLGCVGGIVLYTQSLPYWRITSSRNHSKLFIKSAYSWTNAIDVAIGHSISFTLLWFVTRSGFLEPYPAQVVGTIAIILYVLVVPLPLFLSRLPRVSFFKTTAVIEYSEQSIIVDSYDIHPFDKLAKVESPKRILHDFLITKDLEKDRLQS
ncbi:MAG: hypothetical protein GF411_15105 [Candidatus Lokiarchaeota archaeon]|nr:hypothetical protein [Candidatus Lokiarchaeota archaeon]